MSPNFFCASPLSVTGVGSGFLRDAGLKEADDILWNHWTVDQYKEHRVHNTLLIPWF